MCTTYITKGNSFPVSLYAALFLRTPRGWLRFICVLCMLLRCINFGEYSKASTLNNKKTKSLWSAGKTRRILADGRPRENARSRGLAIFREYKIYPCERTMLRSHLSLAEPKSEHACLTCVRELRVSRHCVSTASLACPVSVSACAFLQRLFQSSGVFTSSRFPRIIAYLTRDIRTLWQLRKMRMHIDTAREWRNARFNERRRLGWKKKVTGEEYVWRIAARLQYTIEYRFPLRLHRRTRDRRKKRDL